MNWSDSILAVSVICPQVLGASLVRLTLKAKNALNIEEILDDSFVCLHSYT